MKSILAMGAVLMATMGEIPPPAPHWHRDEFKKQTKDRSKVKAARKQKHRSKK